MRWQIPRPSNDWALWLLLVLVTLVVLRRAPSVDDPILAPVHPDPPWGVEPPPRIVFPAQGADDDRVYEEAWR